jgi:drug/metabolite transporter (DMT)-like permease
MGFEEFAITPDMTGNKILFAGVRFTFSGLIILAFAKAKHRSFAMRRKTDWWFMLLFALLNTTFHYSTFCIGLSFSAGARAAILNSLSVFLLVIMACIFFKSDRFTMGKVLGCVLGFAGILALNMGGAESGHFTLLGDGMIIVNALCSAVASLLTRSLIKRVDVFVGTGYSLGLGGLLLLVPSLLAGATMPQITWWGLVILLLLIGISALSFVLYNKLISCNPVGKVAIFNSLIPVVGAVTSCLCLGETFYWKYVIAGALATAGIYIINKQK